METLLSNTCTMVFAESITVGVLMLTVSLWTFFSADRAKHQYS